MELITKSKFARIIGCSPQFVEKIQDRLTFVSGKGKKPKIDLHGAETIRYLSEREEKKSLGIIKETPISSDKTENNQENSNEKFIIGGLKTKFTDKRNLENEKIREQIEKLRIENEQKRGNLIPRNLIVKIFNKLYSIDENQLKPIGITIMPKISGVYNSGNETKAKEILEIVGLPKTDDKKSEITKILSNGETDRINEGSQIIEDCIGDVLKNIQRTIEKFLNSITE